VTELAPPVEGRPLVPTARQIEVGDLPAPVALDVPEEEQDPLRRGGWRRIVSDVDPRHVEGPKKVLLILCLTSLFLRIDDAAVGVLLPSIRAEFGVSLTFFGIVSALVGILMTSLLIPFGYLADRMKRVWLLRVGTLFTAGTVAVQGVVPSVTTLVAARLANGVGQGMSQPASFPLLADWFRPTSRTRVFGIYFAAAQLGLVVGPVTAGLLGDALGWRAALLVLGGMATAVALLTFLLREPPRGAFERPDALERPDPPAPTFAESYRAAASVTTLRRLWYATPLLSARGAFTFIVLPFVLFELYGLSITQLGIVQTVNGVLGLVALLFAGVIGDRLLTSRPGRYMVLMGLAAATQAGVIALIALRPPVLVAIVGMQVFVVVEAALTPAFYSLIATVVPARIRGLGLTTQAPWQLIGIVGMPFVLAGAEAIGIESGGFLLFVPLLLLAALILGSSASGVERDIRAARAADAAEDALRQARERGTTPLLVCRDVQVAYGGVQVLFGVDLDVQEGEVVALVGTNGAGKSTLLRALAGTSEPSGGAVFFDDRDTTHLPPHSIAALGIVSMPGGAAVFPGLSVAENLRAAAWTVRDDPETVEQRTAEVLDLFPVLRQRLDSPAGALSGGEQQMVGLSQALLMAPRLLLVDELSLGLAPSIVEQLLSVLREINARGTTILMVEQSLNVALTIADRAVFMEKGEIRFDGPTEELLARPDLVRSVFMGGAAGGTRTVRRTPPTELSVTPALEVRDLAVSFGGVEALRGVDLTVSAGEVVGIIGPNGAGKTTLFDLVSGFTRPDRGRVLLAGVDVTGASPDARARAGLGRSFQSARLFPALTVRENLAVALERRVVRNPLLAAVWAPPVRAAERRVARRVDKLIDLLGLNAYADATLAELSTGSRRAVDVACILALEPSLLLLDEPSSGLAQAETEALGPLLQRIVRETGCGMLVIEHDLPLVTALSDRMVAMEGGALLVTGTPEQVRSDPRVLASYLAASHDVVQRSGRLGALAALLDEPHPDERT
jgi:ABC-type branched-subunit amino acid transport system ATPase component/predicted MFS family arabinose efflux permease